MSNYNSKDEINQSMALIKICKDLLEHKKRDTKILFITLIVSLLVNLAIVGAFLLYESGWEYSDSITTTTTTEQSADGKDGNIVNGNQFNDKSSGVINNNGSETENHHNKNKNKNKDKSKKKIKK